MAAVLLSACTIRRKYDGEYEKVMIVSPSTMDSADTIDLSNLKQGRTIRGLVAWDSTTGDSVTCTLSTNTITVDAAGGTTDKVYNIEVTLL
jgi:hypothetical protein